MAAHCIIGSIVWMTRWRKPNGRLSLDAIIEQIVAMHIGAIMRR